MPIFNEWCDQKREDDKKTSLWTVSEKANIRDKIFPKLLPIVRSHYEDLTRIADALSELGYKKAEKILKGRMPQTATARSGDLGEILATEFAEEAFDFTIPIKRLRYKDGRDMPLRGDDFIGIRYNEKEGLFLLKGESKSRLKLTKTVITEARTVLNKDNGRCTPISLSFVYDRLLDSTDDDDKKLGKILRNEVANDALPPSKITHALITFSGNSPIELLRSDLKAADAKRSQNVVNIYIPDHVNFIKLTFEKAQKLGNP
ncbi:Hachiman antiphage defense system protein HamA [Ferruginibacter albus]|uniref:Hachiman antiphage defense system protein HamA n=1 Tax=Ferruginibacter albus TaxID=2875540 RepID=UPI001CC6B791|nr:Hachiman antiphage defense system protein HamA [Ferruginibacter albus]UAY53207.1 DUF1837 domain-containing protein [Ferruginibacter albus]